MSEHSLPISATPEEEWQALIRYADEHAHDAGTEAPLAATAHLTGTVELRVAEYQARTLAFVMDRILGGAR